MGILLSISTVLFAIMCVILVIIILLQSDKSAGMGILGGSSQSAFGSSTADVITKITTIMVAIFMLGSLGLAVMESTRTSSLKDKVMTSDKPSTEVLQKDETKKEPAAPKDADQKKPGVK